MSTQYVCHTPKPTLQEDSRSRELRELQAGLGATNATLEALCATLGLPSGHLAYMYEALEEGRWRKARAPFNYVASVAERKHRASVHVFSPKQEARIDDLGLTFDYLQVLHSSESDRERFWADAEEDKRWRRLKEQLPARFIRKHTASGEALAFLNEWNADPETHFLPTQGEVIDFQAIAHEAGLDEAERRVLEARLLGTGRAEVMAGCTDAKLRLGVQAAWRRFERSILPKLRPVLKPFDTHENIFRR